VELNKIYYAIRLNFRFSLLKGAAVTSNFVVSFFIKSKSLEECIFSLFTSLLVFVFILGTASTCPQLSTRSQSCTKPQWSRQGIAARVPVSVRSRERTDKWFSGVSGITNTSNEVYVTEFNGNIHQVVKYSLNDSSAAWSPIVIGTIHRCSLEGLVVDQCNRSMIYATYRDEIMRFNSAISSDYPVI